MFDDQQLRDTLLSLTQSPELHDQHALLARLQAAGFNMTQSTLSRKLKQLGFEKRGGVYQLPVTRARVLTVQPVPPNLLVLKTEPGYAQALAAQLDRTPLPGQARSEERRVGKDLTRAINAFGAAGRTFVCQKYRVTANNAGLRRRSKLKGVAGFARNSPKLGCKREKKPNPSANRCHRRAVFAYR